MTTKDRVKMWLLHDLLMYDDVLKILEIVAAGITWQEYHFFYVIFKIFYSIAVVGLNVPNLNREEWPYPTGELDTTEEHQITDQVRD